MPCRIHLYLSYNVLTSLVANLQCSIVKDKTAFNQAGYSFIFTTQVSGSDVLWLQPNQSLKPFFRGKNLPIFYLLVFNFVTSYMESNPSSTVIQMRGSLGFCNRSHGWSQGRIFFLFWKETFFFLLFFFFFLSMTKRFGGNCCCFEGGCFFSLQVLLCFKVTEA